MRPWTAAEKEGLVPESDHQARKFAYLQRIRCDACGQAWNSWWFQRLTRYLAFSHVASCLFSFLAFLVFFIFWVRPDAGKGGLERGKPPGSCQPGGALRECRGASQGTPCPHRGQPWKAVDSELRMMTQQQCCRSRTTRWCLAV